MPPHTSNRGLVAITGANGTIGYASVLHALHTNYRVRCILRRADAISKIKAGPSIQQFLDKIEFAIVPDNTVPGAYDEVIQGAEYVIHIAGVWPMPHYHPDNDIYYPFVHSMQNMLSAAEKSGTVKRIVFTQAGAGLVSTDAGELGTRMDEVLNEFVPVNQYAANLRPPLASPHHAYTSAKAYCMSHLLSLQSSEKLPFSIVQVIPGTVIGPSELISSASEALNAMDRMSKALLFNAMPAPRYAFGFVHVEDCARVHVEALDSSKVTDDKISDFFIAAASTPRGCTAQSIWKGVGDMIEHEFSDEVETGVFQVGRENVPLNMPFRVDSGLTERTLFEKGERFRSLEECVREVAGWYVGLLGKKR